MSRLIKSASVITIEQLKQLQSANAHKTVESQEEQTTAAAPEQPDEETISLRDQIIQDAQTVAGEQLQDARTKSEQLLADAKQQIEDWWQEQREADAAAAEQARHEGYQAGFTQGSEESRQQLQSEWQSKLDLASSTLKQAYVMREQIIQEAEPFLVELSCAIAEKIIGQQLTQSPETAIQLIRQSLSRRREQGVITLCVAPTQLSFLQASREELNTAIDSQAELQILPDSTVKDMGCVIRSSFGSIDARIDTQLSEIKQELLQLSHHIGEERVHSHEPE
ncbi:FliH/SctL family protein [Paenibacillus sp. HB172176]|uniref:FliH/SctL family protein n=1 Tax=Paenibacillus sp. HB172176 TaxID=2493690 RepID=UPI001439A471|nr:FliH/SctL family protein [Paenibacillus sp. HB172176]